MTVRTNYVFILVALAGLLARPVDAAPIELTERLAFIHDDSGLHGLLGTSDVSFFSTLDADNFGTFGWTFSNLSGAPMTNVTAFGFLDADIDRSVNTAFNESGAFLSLLLPAGAPSGAVSATSWEIDEPGVVFGDIIDNLLAGALDGTNAVHAAAPDDVSFALGFVIGTLNPGDLLRLTFELSPLAVAGLQQMDPDSQKTFSYNGYATVTPSDLTPVPEPSTLVLMTTASIVAAAVRRRRTRGRVSTP